MATLAMLCVAGSVVSGFCALLSGSAPVTVLAVGLLLLGVELALLNRVAGGFSAVMVPVLAVNGVLLSAMFLWDRIREESIVSFRFQVTEQEHIHASVIGIVFSAIFTFGALIGRPTTTSLSVAKASRAIHIPNAPLIAVGYLGIALTVYARQDVLLSGRYNEVPGPEWAASISNALTPLAILALCIAASRPGPGRAVAAFGVGIWFLILFGRASRTLAALPGLLVFARAFATGEKVKARSIMLAAAGTVFLLQLPLVGRANPEGVGVIPLSEQLITRPSEIFEGFSLGAILGNILFSGPLTAVVASRNIDMHAFWVSINPAPGGMAGWPEIKDSLRIIVSTPYNALGELASHGWIALAAVAFTCGLLLALATRVASSLRGVFGMSASLLTFGVTAFFSVSILQYNLRSSVRLIWYILIAVGLIWAVSVITLRNVTTHEGLPGRTKNADPKLPVDDS